MTKVLRGDLLKDAVRVAIKQLVVEAKQSGSIKINFSDLAKAVGTSRPSLYKMTDFIDDCMVDAKTERRLANGSSERKKLDQRVKSLEATIEDLSKELLSLRQNHVEIYRRLYANSSDLTSLIKPVLIKDSTKTTGCILCGHEIKGIGVNKVVKLFKDDG
jgi:hypothetical protein